MYKYLLLLSMLFSAMMFNIANAEEKEAVKAEKAVAVVNDKALTKTDYDNYLKGFMMPPGITPDKQAVINELINRELVVQNTLKQELDKEAGFQKRLEQLRYNALFEYGIEDYLKKHPVTEEQLKKEYQKFKPIKQYKARHILMQTSQEAMAVINQVQQGVPFVQLAMQRSIDPMSRPQGGDLGWLTQDQMLKSVADAVVGMKKNQVTLQPVQSHVGWHVIMLDDIRDLPPLPFEAAKKELEAAVRTQHIAEYIEQLKKESQIEIK